MRALIFPGQGSQAVGMAKDLAGAFPQAKAVLDEVDAALGQNLSRLMAEGPVEELTLTANAQPALMAASLAVLRVLEAERGLDLQRDIARLLRIRGEAMQAAVAPGEGAMAALIGTDVAAAHTLAEEAAEGQICDVANDNGGGQVVLSGDRGAVERALALAPGKGIKRAVMLNVSAPFHCRLMAPAARRMQEALAGVALKAPTVPLYANVAAAPVSEPDALRASLVEQVTGTVRWRESIAAMAEAGVTQFDELGAGKVLAGLVKRIAPGAKATSVGTPADVAAFAL
jgi:[acyl-carrier-protein] S-malonyltransferase